MTAFASQATVGGRFVIDREIGRGGVGVVYKAIDTLSGQPVALKVIAIAGVDAGEEARFRREGRVLAGLRHPGIVRLVDFGQLDEGQPYVAMEWLEGEDIAQRQKRAPLTIAGCLEVAAQIAEALAAAHAAGIVHRDVKPSNVILVGSGPGQVGAPVPKLVDFGVAAASDAKLTRTGAIIGTPAYMAPEQARGDEEVDARADIYALGATLFEMIAGRPPHVGPTPIAILARLVTTPPPRLGEVLPHAPLELDELVTQLIASSPADRPATAREVATRLRALAQEIDGSVPSRCGGPLDAPPQSGFHEGAPVSVAMSMASPSAGSRVVTSILATHVPKGPARARLIAHLRARGAEATELGGDAIVAHLGSKKALGDEAARAIDLGLRLAKVDATVGIATGRSKMQQTRPMGEVVDRAAALARDAQRGQVLADTTTTELARGRFTFQVRADGAAVVGPAVPGRREQQVGGAPFVGREGELAQILGAFERAVDDRTPVLVSITGAPGMGKTRLRREAIQRISSQSSGARIILARGEAFARAHPLGVAGDIARAMAGVSKGVSLEDAREAVAALAFSSGADTAPDAREPLARLLANEPMPEGADARAARDALWMALTDVTVALAKRAPLCLSVEDAQWSDAESLLWLDHVLGRAAGAPVWVLLATRPGLWREVERFAGRDHVRVELRPLARRHVRAIARAVLGDRAAGAQGDEVAESIASQSGGSPLFAEELARLTAQGRDAASAATIESAMQVQLDALDDPARDAAARLAVFGMSGWDKGLEALGVPYAEDAIRALSEAEVVVEQAASRFPATREWAFKHALMREVAYASLGDEALREMHARAGRWLAKAGEDDATVARHLELGGAHAESAVHLERAARRALAAHALTDAVSMAERALAWADDKPTQFARAQILDEAWSRLDARAGERDTAVRAMEEAVHDAASEVLARGARVRYEDACGGDDETTARLDDVRRTAQAARAFDEEARVAAALASRCAFAGDLDRAAEVAEELLLLAQNHGIAGAAVDAWQTLAVVRQARGDVGAALEARRSAARAASEAGLKAREATLTVNVGFALTTVGAKEEARVAIEGGIALAQAIGSPGTVRHGQMNLLCWAATFGSDAALDKALAEPRGIADAAAAGSWVPHDRATLGVLYYRGLELLRCEDRPCAEQAHTLLNAAAQAYRATKMLDVVPVALGWLAEAKRRCGDAAAARELAREATELLDHGSPSLLNEAPAFLALHDACSDLGRLEEAREAIARGIPRLVTRVRGLAGTPYARDFLTHIASNAGLLAAAEGYDLVPRELAALLDRGP